MDALPVTIIVKAPNQQFEDQTIKCEPTWSIRKLKGYLTEVYPCNPTLEEQKLIYSGQLLNDAHILKDVLRQYEGQDTHTVHLVYTPKNRPPVPTTKPSQPVHKNVESAPQPRPPPSQSQQSESTNADGLRYRNATAPAASANQMPPFMSGYMNRPQPFLPTIAFAQSNANQSQMTPEQYALAQQLHWQNTMQQMYVQYMNQYAAWAQHTNAANVPYFPNYFPQMQQQLGTNPTTTDVQPEPPVQPPRFQAPADDEAEHHDWLEIMYTLSRLMVLLSLVYFYSSPGRCSLVIFVIVLYYLYQHRQRNIRERQQQVRVQEANAEPDVIDAPLENVEQPNDANNDQRNDREPTETIAENDSPSTPLTSITEPDENSRLPTITVVCTFILSFFSSLIPETPAV